MPALLVELAGIGVGNARNSSGILNHGNLHSEADAEIGQHPLSGIFRGQNHALNAPAAEPAGDENAIQALKRGFIGLGRQGFGIDPLDPDMRIVRISRVLQGLGNREIRIVKPDVLPNQTDADMVRPCLDALDHALPIRKLRGRRADPKLPADHRGKVGFFQHQRRFIEVGQRDVFDDTIGADIAEERNLFENGVLQRLVAAQDNDVGVNAHALQLAHRVLRGLGLVLVRAAQKGHQRDMNKEAVLSADLQRDLADGLQKGLGLDVADRAADFGDDHIGVGFLTHPVNKFLDFIGDVRDDLHRGAEILPPALLVEHVPVDLSRGQVGVFVQILVDEAFIVPKIQIGFGAVLGHIHLPMLIRAHGSRIDIDVGVELLRRHLQPSRLEKPAERCGGDALSKPGYHAARYKYEFCHCRFLLRSAAICFASCAAPPCVPHLPSDAKMHRGSDRGQRPDTVRENSQYSVCLFQFGVPFPDSIRPCRHSSSRPAAAKKDKDAFFIPESKTPLPF